MKLILSSLIGLHMFFNFIYACSTQSISYPNANNHNEQIIDELLDYTELLVSRKEFLKALDILEQTESLVKFVEDENGYRLIRLLFDKSITLICLNESHSRILVTSNRLYKALQSHSCDKDAITIDQPFEGPSVMSVDECINTVENVKKEFMLAMSGLSLKATQMFATQLFIDKLGDQVKRCCTQRGFWKTCMQPMVNVLVHSWTCLEKYQAYMIPPDPFWD